jgi:hypothetical protein
MASRKRLMKKKPSYFWSGAISSSKTSVPAVEAASLARKGGTAARKGGGARERET